MNGKDRIEDGMDDAQLRTLLKTLGAKPRGKMKRETMLLKIKQLQGVADKPAEPVSIDKALGLSGVIPEAPKPIIACTQKDVLDAIKPCLERGMMVEFDEWGWVFKRKGRSDSGTLSQPLGNIVKCAHLVCLDAAKATDKGDSARYA